MRVDGNAGAATSYEPNTFDEWQEQPAFKDPPLSIEGSADHWNHRDDDDYYSQPGALFRLMTPTQQQALFENTARELRNVSGSIQKLHIEHCTKAAPAYGAGIVEALEHGLLR